MITFEKCGHLMNWKKELNSFNEVVILKTELAQIISISVLLPTKCMISSRVNISLLQGDGDIFREQS